MSSSPERVKQFAAGVTIKTTVDLILIEEEATLENPHSGAYLIDAVKPQWCGPSNPYSSVAVPAGSTGVTTEDPIFGHAFIRLDDYQTLNDLDLWVHALAVISPLELLAREG